jgi:Holliday junction resolvase RusA-like endonuclease
VGTYRIEHDSHPPRLNQLMGCHWATAHKRKMAYYRLLGTAAKAVAQVPEAKTKRRVSLEVILGYRQKGADPDSFLKVVLDALVWCGVLKDDSKEWVEIGSVSYRRGPRAAMVVVLEDVEDKTDG